MKPDLQRRVQRYGWDKAAAYYNTGWEEQLWQAQERLLLQADLKRGEKVLDIACGTGLITIPAAAIVEDSGLVTGVDISEGMLKTAEKRVKLEKLDYVAFKRMDAEALELPQQSFDVAICSLGLMYTPDPVKAAEEMFKVLKPGGRGIAMVWGERRKCGWAGIFPIVDRRVKSDVCPLFFQLGTGESLQNTFKTAGFKSVHSDRFPAILKFKNGKEACVAAFLGGAVALAYQKFDEGTREEARQEYLDSIAQFKNSSSYAIPGEFVIVKGIK